MAARRPVNRIDATVKTYSKDYTDSEDYQPDDGDYVDYDYFSEEFGAKKRKRNKFRADRKEFTEPTPSMPSMFPRAGEKGIG